jgi:hypothetical protein
MVGPPVRNLQPVLKHYSTNTLLLTRHRKMRDYGFFPFFVDYLFSDKYNLIRIG